MASPLPTMQYLIAFNNGPNDDPALITTIASPGVLGGVNVWTDVTAYVMGHHINRGRQHELSRFEAGTADLDLSDNDGRFNSWNTAGPYYGKLQVGKLLQIRATYNSITYKRFTGNITTWPTIWGDPLSAWKKISAVDAFRSFSLANITNSQYSQTVIADGARAYYRLGDVNTPTAKDSSGNGFDGTYGGLGTQGVTGALTTDSDLAWDANPGGAGLGKGFIICPPNASTTGLAFTHECWMMPHASGIGRWLQYGNNLTYVQENVQAGSGAVYPEIILTDVSGTQDILTASTTVIPIDGKWHHVVWTRDSLGTTFKCYIDGVSVALNIATNTSTPNLSSPNLFNIGGLGVGFAQAGPDFNGSLDEIAVYPTALSAAQVLNHYQLGSVLWPGQTAGVRIGKVLDSIGWPAGARSIDAGDVTLQSVTSSLTNTKALDHMQACEVTEDGALFITGDGKVRFISRSSQTASPYNTSQVTFGDNVGEVTFQVSPDLALDDLDIRNENLVTNNGGIQQSSTDATSIATYGRRTSSISGNLASSDSDALKLAQWLTARYANPVERLRKIDVRPLDSPAVFFPAVMARELLDRCTVIRRYNPGQADAFRLDAIIEGIEESMTPDEWVVSFRLANALPPVGLYDDGTFGRYSDSSPLTSTITAGATSLVVTIPTNTPAWTTVDVPLQVSIDAEILTISAISAVSGGQQTLTISARGANNTTAAAHTAGALVQPYPACVYGY